MREAPRSWARWLVLSAVVVVLDLATKEWVSSVFRYGETREVLPFFNLVLAYNKGAAFSFLANEGGWQRYLFSGIAVAAAIFIIYLLKRHAGQRLFCWALALVLGGAIGNLIDRIAYGHVIDFLDVHVAGWHWPAFNIADSAICIGAAMFIIDELRRVNR